VLLDYGADIRAQSDFDSSALHTCFYFGAVECAEELLFHDFKEGVPVQRPDVSLIITTTTGDFKPLDSAAKRDCYKMWQFVIREESRLREYGYDDLVIGAKNFNKLLSLALVCKAFKCIVVLMEFYE